jgi:hypothetical protein
VFGDGINSESLPVLRAQAVARPGHRVVVCWFVIVASPHRSIEPATSRCFHPIRPPLCSGLPDDESWQLKRRARLCVLRRAVASR